VDTNIDPAAFSTAPVQRTASAPNSLNTRGTALATGGSIIAAFLASACCVGPLILALLGLGGGALLVKFEPYRPYLIVLTFTLLGAGFYLTYRKQRLAPVAMGADGTACDCPAPRTNRAGRIMLWVASVLVVGFLVFPYLVPVLFN
jgi:mercuric ion transport protein